MRTKDKIDFVKLLNYNLSYNPFYVKLFETTSQILDNYIVEPLYQLDRVKSSLHIRRGDYLTTKVTSGSDEELKQLKVTNVQPIIHDGIKTYEITLQLNQGASLKIYQNATQDRQILVNESILNGFNFYSDFLTDEDYQRVVDYIGSYWQENSGHTTDFINFIGFIKNIRLQLNPLWSKDIGEGENFDFYPFLEEYDSNMKSIRLGGDNFLTSHVEIEYDALISDKIDTDLIHLFYLLAPANLVLQRLLGVINVEERYSIKAIGDIMLIESGYIKIV